MTIVPFVILWAAAAVSVLGLALYRKLITIHGDDEFVHLGEGEQNLIPQQVALGAKLEFIDRWGKGLTVFIVAYGLLIVSYVLYQAWLTSLKMP